MSNLNEKYLRPYLAVENYDQFKSDENIAQEQNSAVSLENTVPLEYPVDLLHTSLIHNDLIEKSLKRMKDDGHFQVPYIVLNTTSKNVNKSATCSKSLADRFKDDLLTDGPYFFPKWPVRINC